MKAKVFKLNNNHSLSHILNACRVALNSSEKQGFEVVIQNAKTKAEKRELAQNSLNWHWCGQLSNHSKEYTSNEIHQMNKLDYGVPILCRDKDFMLLWQPYKYYTRESQLKILKLLPVTRIMTMEQMTEYLSTLKIDMESNLGIKLTTKEDLYNEAMGRL